MEKLPSQPGSRPHGKQEASRGLTIAWPIVAIILGVITLTSLGTLVVITHVNKVDVLSEVALSLAVVSFAAQLIVTMAQAQQSTQVASETKAALSEMRATTNSLEANQRGQFDTVLKALVQRLNAAVEEVVDEAEPTEGDMEGHENTLQKRITEAVADAQAAAAVATARGSSEQVAMAERTAALRDQERKREREQLRMRQVEEWQQLMASYPARDEGEPVAKLLRNLPPRAVRLLAGELAHRARMAAVAGLKSFKVPMKDEEDESNSTSLQQLAEVGLIEIIKPKDPDDTSRRFYVRLTSTGVTALRILSAKGDPPEWAAGL